MVLAYLFDNKMLNSDQVGQLFYKVQFKIHRNPPTVILGTNNLQYNLSSQLIMVVNSHVTTSPLEIPVPAFVQSTVLCLVEVLGHSQHQDNMSVCFIPPYTPLLYSKTAVYRGINIFLIFALKHRMWVLVRKASVRRF